MISNHRIPVAYLQIVFLTQIVPLHFAVRPQHVSLEIFGPFLILLSMVYLIFRAYSSLPLCCLIYDVQTFMSPYALDAYLSEEVFKSTLSLPESLC